MSGTTPTRRFFSGTSLERAVLEAAGHYGLEPEQLAYTKQEKRGIGSRGKVVVRVDPENPRRTDEAEAPGGKPAENVSAQEVVAKEVDVPEATTDEPAVAESAPEEPVDAPEADREESPELAEPAEQDEAVEEEAAEASGDTQEEAEETADGASDGKMSELPRSSAEARREWKQASGPAEQAARKWTESLLRVASLDLEVEIYERNNELEVHLGGADAEVAVEDGGEVLRAIQHLLPRLLLGTVGESVPCRVDCNDFRELHEERLRSQALEAAAEALAGRGEVTLDPMHPADRRIIHLALADNELLRTESLGRGFFKRVSVRRS